jgi:hypothetical protein
MAALFFSAGRTSDYLSPDLTGHGTCFYQKKEGKMYMRRGYGKLPMVSLLKGEIHSGGLKRMLIHSRTYRAIVKVKNTKQS